MSIEKLSEFFKKHNKTVNINTIIRELKIDYKDVDTLLNLLYELEKKGEIYKDSDDTYMHVPNEFYLKHGVLEHSNKNNFYINFFIITVWMWKRWTTDS